MKVAISIPNDLFAKADAFADRAKMPRSQVYALALDQFLSRESEQEAIARINV